MLFMAIAVPVDTLHAVMATFYSHQHPQYTLVDISVCCAIRIATLGHVTTFGVAQGDVGVRLLIFIASCMICKSPNSGKQHTVRNVKVREPCVRTDDFTCMYLFWSRRGVANRTDKEKRFLATRRGSDEKPGHGVAI